MANDSAPHRTDETGVPADPLVSPRGGRDTPACRRTRGPRERHQEELKGAYHAGLAAVGAIIATTTDLEELHPGGCPGCAVCGLLLPILRAGRAAVLEAARAARR